MLGGASLALAASVRAQVPGVELRWQGPPRCAEPTGVMAEAHSLVGDDLGDRAPLVVRVAIQDLADEGLRVELDAQGTGHFFRRELTLPSCEEARQATALMIALTLDPDLARAPIEEPAPATPPAVVAEPQDPDRSGPSLGVNAGFDPSELSEPTAAFGIRLAWRWSAVQIEASGSYWLPTHSQVTAGVDLDADMAGGAVHSCYWLTFGRWDLGPCLGLEVMRVHGFLNGADAGSDAWFRVGLGPRLAVWLSAYVALSVSADPLLGLNRPRFASASGDSAQAPAFGFVSRLGVSFAPR